MGRMESQNTDCSCFKCVGACKQEPGRFAPGEAEKVAKFLNMDFKKFLYRYLIIDYWSGEASNGVDLYSYAPKKETVEHSSMYASYEYPFKADRCVFLENDLCKIHDVKPFECRKAIVCGNLNPYIREHIGLMWEEVGNPLAPYNN